MILYAFGNNDLCAERIGNKMEEASRFAVLRDVKREDQMQACACVCVCVDVGLVGRL